MSASMRFRVRLGKGDEMRFVSHLGYMRAFERAVRRAQIPVAYSLGYHPHPKISFATALGVGMTSEAEYLDIELNLADSGELSTLEVFELLQAATPQGMPVIAVCAAHGKPALASRIEWASYRANVQASIQPELERAATDFLASESAIAEINTKSGRRRADVRPMVRNISWRSGGVLECTLACGGRAHLRPQDLLAHLGLSGACVYRTGLYFTDRESGDLVSPMSVECTDLVMAMGFRPGELTRGS